MKMLTTLSLLNAILITGCAGGPRYWYSDAKTFDQIRQDCIHCTSRADEEAHWHIDRERGFERLGAGAEHSEYKTSFTDTGFGPGRAEQKAITFRICMERKGYRRVKKAKLVQGIFKKCGHAAPPGECLAGKQP